MIRGDTFLMRRDKPNQAMQLTAGRFDVSLYFMKSHLLQATLALASGG